MTSSAKTSSSAIQSLKAHTMLARIYLDYANTPGNGEKLRLAGLVIKEAINVLKRPHVHGRCCMNPETPLPLDRAVAEMHATCGLVSLRQGRISDAAVHFEKALRCHRHSVEANLNRAAIALGWGGHWIAYESLRNVLSKHPRNVVALLTMGATCRGLATTPPRRGIPRKSKSAWYQMADAFYQKARAVSPKTTAALFNLAVLYAQFATNPRTALKWFKLYLAQPTTHTTPDLRRIAQEQISEIEFMMGKSGSVR